MYGHRQSGAVRLFNRGVYLLLRVEVRAVVGDQLDDRGAVINILTHRLADLVRRVGVDVFEAPERSGLWRNAMRLPSKCCDDFSGVDDGGSFDPALVDAPAQVGVNIV